MTNQHQTEVNVKLARAWYDVSDLASLAGVDRHKMRRMLIAAKVTMQRRGRTRVVFIQELRDTAPDIWDGLCLRLSMAARFAEAEMGAGGPVRLAKLERKVAELETQVASLAAWRDAAHATLETARDMLGIA